MAQGRSNGEVGEGGGGGGGGGEDHVKMSIHASTSAPLRVQSSIVLSMRVESPRLRARTLPCEVSVEWSVFECAFFTCICF